MSGTIPSLERALHATRLLAEESNGLTPAELARRAGLSRATSYRVLKTLQATGMAIQREHSYRAGPEMIRMASLVLDQGGIRAAAGPVLSELAEAAGHTSHLAVRSGDRVIIVEVCDGPEILRVASRPGSLVWLHCSSTGKALLSTMDQADARAAVLRSGLPGQTKRTHTAWEPLAADLQRCRRRGYAIDDREYHDDVRCVAAALQLDNGPAEWAIGVTGPAAALTLAKVPGVGERVSHAAERLAKLAIGEKSPTRATA